MKFKVLLIEPDRQIKKLIDNLLAESYEMFFAKSESEAYSLFSQENPDIIIIDPLFPSKEGLEFIKALRKWSDCPIIVISANGTERAAVRSFDAGADDFIRKPFFSEELCSRVAVAARRISMLNAAKGIYNTPRYINGELTLEFDSHLIFINKTRICLTKNEFKIFSLLCRNAGKVLTYDYILKSVWGPRTDSNTGILRVNIANLRRKLEKDPLNPQYLFTENGVGYRVAENQF